LLLAREITEKHLRSLESIGGFSVVYFDSWQSAEWKEYLEKTVPSFIMISDRDTTSLKDVEDISYYLRAFFINSLKLSQHCVFTSHLIPVSNKVLGYVVAGHTTVTGNSSLCYM
jgi:hypothetical protein